MNNDCDFCGKKEKTYKIEIKGKFGYIHDLNLKTNSYITTLYACFFCWAKKILFLPNKFPVIYLVVAINIRLFSTKILGNTNSLIDIWIIIVCVSSIYYYIKQEKHKSKSLEEIVLSKNLPNINKKLLFEGNLYIQPDKSWLFVFTSFIFWFYLSFFININNSDDFNAKNKIVELGYITKKENIIALQRGEMNKNSELFHYTMNISLDLKIYSSGVSTIKKTSILHFENNLSSNYEKDTLSSEKEKYCESMLNKLINKVDCFPVSYDSTNLDNTISNYDNTNELLFDNKGIDALKKLDMDITQERWRNYKKLVVVLDSFKVQKISDFYEYLNRNAPND